MDWKNIDKKVWVRQLLISSAVSVIGMNISHHVSADYFWLWVITSLLIGHLVNRKNYISMSKKNSVETSQIEGRIFRKSQNNKVKEIKLVDANKTTIVIILWVVLWVGYVLICSEQFLYENLLIHIILIVLTFFVPLLILTRNTSNIKNIK